MFGPAPLPTSPGVADESPNQSEQHQKEADYQHDKTVSCDAFFVAQRTKSLDSSGRQITDQLGVRGGRPSQMVAETPDQRGKIILPDSEIVVMLGGVHPIWPGFEAVAGDFFKNRLISTPPGRALRRGGGRQHVWRVRSLWARRGTKAWLFLVAMKLGIQHLDLRFDLRDLIAERPFAVRDRVWLFSEPSHEQYEGSASQQENQQGHKSCQRHQR